MEGLRKINFRNQLFMISYVILRNIICKIYHMLCNVLRESRKNRYVTTYVAINITNDCYVNLLLRLRDSEHIKTVHINSNHEI